MSSRVAGAFRFSIILSSSVALAATAQSPGAHRAGIALTAGIAGLPDALSTQCGSKINGDGAFGPEIGVAALVRPRRWLVVQADTRVATELPDFGCTLVLPSVDTTYAENVARDPLVTSTIRVGLEPATDFGLFRVTAGTGVSWGALRLPVAVFSIGWSTQGRRAQFLIEAEWMKTWVDALEVHHQANFTIPIRVSPTSHTGRIGVEFPLGVGR